MDSKETLDKQALAYPEPLRKFRFPIVGVILTLIASMAFYACHTHDKKVWKQLYEYHSIHLLKIEKSHFQDFYSKRLLIENLGSANELASIKSAIQSNHRKQLTKLILSDRSFRIFLEQKAPIYFSPEERVYWQTHNKEVKEKEKLL